MTAWVRHMPDVPAPHVVANFGYLFHGRGLVTMTDPSPADRRVIWIPPPPPSLLEITLPHPELDGEPPHLTGWGTAVALLSEEVQQFLRGVAPITGGTVPRGYITPHNA